MMIMEAKLIPRDKELNDSYILIDKIKAEGWMNPETVIVSCFPDYSAGLSFFLNHKLSVINENELFAQIKLEMPYPNMSQVWNDRMEYEHFDTYLKEWENKYLSNSYKYLFVADSVTHGRSLNKLKLTIRTKLEPDNYRFATLYCSKSAIIKPDYVAEEIDEDKILFWWENEKNPNWNY